MNVSKILAPLYPPPDVFIPSHDSLMVNLKESKEVRAAFCLPIHKDDCV